MRTVIAVALLAGLAGSAQAGGRYEGLGQTGCPDKETFPRSQLRQLSCRNLWTVRNGMYNDHGYCFKTKAAAAAFDNSDCYAHDANKIKFNGHERNNIDRIVKIERQKGC